jgi:hypothetical protein
LTRLILEKGLIDNIYKKQLFVELENPKIAESLLPDGEGWGEETLDSPHPTLSAIAPALLYLLRAIVPLERNVVLRAK